MMKARRDHTLRTVLRLWLGAGALCALPLIGHAQTYQVGQYLGNLNEAGRFAYNTIGSAAQHANYGPGGANWTTLAGQNSVRMAGTASATIGGRTVPLTLISRVPVPAIATAARGIAMANPATAAVTLLGFAAMNGWLTASDLRWNHDSGTNLTHPFRREGHGELTPDPYVVWLNGGQRSAGPCPGMGRDNSNSNSGTVYCTSPNANGDMVYNGIFWQRFVECTGGGFQRWHHDSDRPTCAPIPVPTWEPVTWEQAMPSLADASKDYVGVDWRSIVEQLLRSGGSIHPSDITITVSGPSSQPGQKTTTTGTAPNGDPTTTTTTTTHNYTYNNNNVTHNTTTVTTTINNITNETTNETTETTENPEPKEPDDPCKLNPDALMCKKVELDTPDGEIPRAERQVSFEEESMFGTGACPADHVLNLSGGRTFTMSYQPTCNALATYVKPVIIALAFLAAYFIVMPGGRSS